jgi:hypothetical protein
MALEIPALEMTWGAAIPATMPAAKSRLVSFIQKPPWGRASLSALLGIGGL